MTRHDKLIDRILRGAADANIDFDDLCALLGHLGFTSRVRGSHHMFSKSGVSERINRQRNGAKAKPYQVRQVRSIIVKYRLGGE